MRWKFPTMWMICTDIFHHSAWDRFSISLIYVIAAWIPCLPSRQATLALVKPTFKFAQYLQYLIVRSNQYTIQYHRLVLGRWSDSGA